MVSTSLFEAFGCIPFATLLATSRSPRLDELSVGRRSNDERRIRQGNLRWTLRTSSIRLDYLCSRILSTQLLLQRGVRRSDESRVLGTSEPFGTTETHATRIWTSLYVAANGVGTGIKRLMTDRLERLSKPRRNGSMPRQLGRRIKSKQEINSLSVFRTLSLNEIGFAYESNAHATIVMQKGQTENSQDVKHSRPLLCSCFLVNLILMNRWTELYKGSDGIEKMKTTQSAHTISIDGLLRTVTKTEIHLVFALVTEYAKIDFISEWLSCYALRLEDQYYFSWCWCPITKQRADLTIVFSPAKGSIRYFRLIF